MIPLKLQIKNFLSYGAHPQIIEFGNYPLICLSGKNGHGKSALLDALTWALWGQARKISGNAKADQGLLRLGQTQMMVCLDFSCNNQFYRVRREFMQTYGKPVAILDFGLLDPATDKFIPLTEKTIKDTQAKIDSMLHLSFDAFINSAFLRQGQANEFSKKSPKERKEVLASILGLDRYENVRKLAAERVKQTITSKSYLEVQKVKLEQELTGIILVEQKLQTLEVGQQEIHQHLVVIEEDKKKLEVDIHKLRTQEQEHKMLMFEKQKLEQEQQKLTQLLQENFYHWRTIHKQSLQKIDMATLEQQKISYTQQVNAHQQALHDQLIIKQDFLLNKELAHKLAHEFQEKKLNEIHAKKIAIERILAQQKHIQSIVQELETSKIRLEKSANDCQQQQQAASKMLPACPAINADLLEKQFEKRKEHYQRWVAHANLLSTELATLERKNQLTDHEESPSCPLCEQNLSASRKRFLKKKFQSSQQYLEHTLARLRKILASLKPILIAQHAQLEQIKKQAHNTQIITLKIEEYSKQLEKYQEQKAELLANTVKQNELFAILASTLLNEQASLSQMIKSTQEELEADSAYKKIKELLHDFETKLASNLYNKAAHENTLNQLKMIEDQLMRYASHKAQELLKSQHAQDIKKLCPQLKIIKAQLINLDASLAAYSSLPIQQSAIEQKKKEVELAIGHFIKLKEALLQEKGSLENQKQKLEQLKQECLTHGQELKICDQIIDDYTAIASATGKDGIQALLIEDTIPEIEHEANELLAKLTDNQTQLFIESLRDLKKGGTKETLDIKISDAAGIRPYELFSGGEAFRIDFALRIAISKLLARRAGTSLQTLIIDEGFGSQDEEGLANIMESLYKIQDDFAKIIIVSHLNSMKNQFPVHFVIEKGPQGSIVEILEQG